MKLLIILLVALPTVIFAQTNFHQGYVVKTNGDTVKGYVDYREWGQNPLSIDFRVNKDDKQTQQFTPSAIKSFQINGLDTYISYVGLISQDRNHFPDLAGRLDTSKIQATVFLKLLASGSHISLYNHIDNKKTRFFVAEGSETPVELKYYQYYNENRDAVERPFFCGQMIFYINKYVPENTGLTSTAERTGFDDDPLINLVNQINGNKGGLVNGVAKTPNLRFFAGAGAQYNKARLLEYYSVATNNGSYLYKVNTSSICVYPKFNLGVDVFVNPNVQKFIFRTELAFSFVSTKLLYPVTDTKNNQLSYDQFITSLTPQLLYNVYNTDSFKLYLDIGFSASISKYSNIAFIDPATGLNDPNNTTDGFYNYVTYLPLQAGIVLNKKFEAAFTYTPYAKITSYSAIAVSNQSFGLGVKYFFDSK
jgi:hypothetical protein